jgi:Zn-dependent peptidase ImmA (M78 family)
VLNKLAFALNVNRNLLSRAMVVQPGRLSHRPGASPTHARATAEARYQWFLETMHYVGGCSALPPLNLPSLPLSDQISAITPHMIEECAQQLRQHWLLGSDPIANVVELLERNGIVVWRMPIDFEIIEAFSDYRLPNPVVVLGSEPGSFFRSRVDAAHELGHLLMHPDLHPSTLVKREGVQPWEEQAHHFARAFLLPAQEFRLQIRRPSLETFKALKSRWGTPISVQITRCLDLDLVNDDQAARLSLDLSQRGWRGVEPLDDSIPEELPTLMSGALRSLVDAKTQSIDEMFQDLSLGPDDVEVLAGLPAGALNGKQLPLNSRTR